MTALPITRVVLYKHGVGYFEREGIVDGDATLALTFRQAEVSDVLKSLTVLDLGGGHIASVSYDSTKPLAQLLAEVALSIPDQGSLVGLIPQLKGARVALHTGVADAIQGSLLGIDTTERQTADGVVKLVLVSVLTDAGDVRQCDLHGLVAMQLLDPALRRDLDFYLKTQLSAKKKDARTFTFFAQGPGRRTVRLSYTLEAPVWKATYRLLLGEEGKPPLIQGWAVVDNMQDEDWEEVRLSLIAGLPVSFVHDLYTPRYIRRPEVRVQETTGVLPPEMEEGVMMSATGGADAPAGYLPASPAAAVGRKLSTLPQVMERAADKQKSAVSSVHTQTRERKLGDLFEYAIEHPVTIRRNQSALVPIVLREFAGRPVLLYNKQTRANNPLRCVELKNTTGLTLEGGPVTVLEAGSYVGEAMLETTKPDDERLVPFAVELSVFVLDNVDTKEGTVSRVVIRHGRAVTHRAQVRRTTYTIRNKGDHEQTLYLEHPRERREWELVEPAKPHEVMESYWRFRFPLPAKQVTPFVVSQRFVSQQEHSLSDLNEQRLGYWLQGRFFDGKTEQVLRDVVSQNEETARLTEQIARLQQERETIHAEQKRLRENLQSLGDRHGEKELRDRFVRRLSVQEDRLERIDAEIKAAMQARDTSHEKVAALLERLEYDAEVK